MLSSWFVLLGSVLASTYPSAIEFSILESSGAVALGEIVGVEQCLSDDLGTAWTFVGIDVESVLVGKLSSSGDEPEDRFTIRFKAGEFPDGSVGALHGTPLLSLGETVVVVLNGGAGGAPTISPLVRGPSGVFRIFEFEPGRSAVIDGQGRALVKWGDGSIPLRGPIFRRGRAFLPLSEPIDYAALAADLTEYTESIGHFPGVAPDGPWMGLFHARAGLTMAGQYTEGRCTGGLRGVHADGVLELSGRCNADFLGVVDVSVVGDYADGLWTGVASASSELPGAGSGTMSWLSDVENNDAFSTSVFENNSDGEGEFHIQAIYAGGRPLASKGELLSWLQGLGELYEGGIVNSVPMSEDACNYEVSIAD